MTTKPKAEDSYVRELPLESGQYGRQVEVTLTTGRTVLVRAVPPFLTDKVMSKYPLPEPPIRIIKSQLPGGVDEHLLDEQDPQYLLDTKHVLEQQQTARTDLMWQYGIIGVDVPVTDDWKRDIEMATGPVPWRDGDIGRRLDYIQCIVVSNQEDYMRVLSAIMGISRTTQESIEEAVKSFRSSLQGPPAEPIVAGAPAE